MVALPEARDDDVAALDQADARSRPSAPSRPFEHLGDPGAGGVDDHPRRDGAAARQLGGPGLAVAAGGEQFGAGGDLGAALGGVERVEDDQPGIVDPGVPIGGEPEARASAARERGVACATPRERGRLAAAGEQIVERRARARIIHHGRPPGGSGRTNSSGRTMCGAVREQDLALVQRFADQPELVLLEIAQAAVDQLGRGRAGMGGEIVLLDQQHVEPAPGRVARDRRAVDAAADDRGGRSSPCAAYPAPRSSFQRKLESSTAVFKDSEIPAYAGMTGMASKRLTGAANGRRHDPRHRCGHDEHAGDAVRRRTGRASAPSSSELAQHYPRPGWVEHDAGGDLGNRASPAPGRWSRKRAAAERIAGIGITNQRETIVFWSRRTGEALAPAIVWQDRRTADLCAALKAAGHEPALQAKTGLLLDPYFSAQQDRLGAGALAALSEAGDDLCVGTVESWLVFKLTGGLHVSDATNASRTALMDIHTGGWDDGLLGLFGRAGAARCPRSSIAPGAMARPRLFGAPIAICGMAGDQQAAAIGQACLAPGDTKATYGTGAFVLTHTGAEAPVSRHRLLTTVAWQLGGERALMRSKARCSSPAA